ncbi:hypothetical protein EPN87_01245 [archaeon]|nr:MAG: hypothetical protein EPN87_01245 [archaeon]
MKRKRNVKPNVVLIIAIIVIAAFNVYMAFSYNSVAIVWNNTASNTTTTYRQTNITSSCTTDADCAWTSTNCCSETAGAHWECVSKSSYVDCQSKQVLCPQVISPKPSQSCSCTSGRCV